MARNGRYSAYLVEDEDEMDEIARMFACELINQCENQQNNSSGLSLFVPRRDAMPGSSRLNSHHDAIEMSDYILCPVTPYSLSNWSRYCRETGLYHKILTEESDTVIIVLVGFPNNSNALAACPREMKQKAKVIFETDWKNDNISWEKLKRALYAAQVLPATPQEQVIPIQCTETPDHHDRSLVRNNVTGDEVSVDSPNSVTTFMDEETTPKENFMTDQQWSSDSGMGINEERIPTAHPEEMVCESTTTSNGPTTLESSASSGKKSLASQSNGDLAFYDISSMSEGTQRLDSVVITDSGESNGNITTVEDKTDQDVGAIVDVSDTGDERVEINRSSLRERSNTETRSARKQHELQSSATGNDTVCVDGEKQREKNVAWNFVLSAWNWIIHY